MEENEAVTLLKRGDLRGLEALMREHQVRAIRTAYVITRDRALAQDIVQTAFLRLYDRIHQLESSRAFRAWFLRSVINDAVKAAARRERQVTWDSETEGISLSDTLADPAPGPLELVEAAETYEELWGALGKLSPKERAVVVLRYYLALSEREMADELHSPLGTIKRRLHTARKHLRDLLRPLRFNASSVESKEYGGGNRFEFLH